MLRLRPNPPSIAGEPIPGDADGRCLSDALAVGNDFTPGLVTISKGGVPYNWDVRQGYGYGGAWAIFKGTGLMTFDTTFVVWRDDQQKGLDAWIQRYCPPFNFTKKQIESMLTSTLILPWMIPTPKAIALQNPILTDLGVRGAVPKLIGQWTKIGAGKWQKTIEWLQYKPPVPMLGRPSGHIDDKPTKVVAQDPIQEEIRAKLQTIKDRQHRIAVLQGRAQ